MDESRNPRLPIVVVDDDPAVLTSQSNVLLSHGFTNLITIEEASKVLPTLEEAGADLVLLDLSMPGVSGQELLTEIHESYPELPIIIITGNGDISTAVECMRLGAVDYMVKAIEENRLVSGVQRALELRQLRRTFVDLQQRMLDQTLSHPEAFEWIITKAPRMHALFLFAESIAPSRETVLITGETGVGKELFAEAIHTVSGRSDPFVRVNSAGLDDHMFSDALFGHRKGAFTGAADSRAGLVTSAKAGTVFLDEIGDLSSTSQVKLLQLLERREYYPIGADLPRRTDARFVVATNRDLKTMADSGEFRKDLYYRLSTHSIRIPPLRERPEDLVPLLSHFLSRAAKDLDRDELGVPPELPALLKRYDFPGNVRELRGMVYDAVARSREGRLSIDSFREAMGSGGAASRFDQIEDGGLADVPIAFGPDLPTIREAVDRLIDEALDRSQGNQSLAASYLGISPQSLSKRLQRRRTKST